MMVQYLSLLCIHEIETVAKLLPSFITLGAGPGTLPFSMQMNGRQGQEFSAIGPGPGLEVLHHESYQ